MNQHASTCPDWNSDYDYSYTLTMGGERGKLAKSLIKKIDVLELMAYAGTKIFDKYG